MKKFKIVVEGQNYNIKVDNIPQKCGFFTTRFIEADSSSDVEDTVMKLVRDELKDVILNDQSDPPVMYIDGLVEVERFGDNDVPGFGFTWFKEEN